MTRVLVTLLLGLAACAGPARFTVGDRAAVLDLIERQQAAWNRGDLAAYMDGYERSPDLVFTSGGKIRRGFDDAYSAYQKRYGSDKSGMGKLAFEILGVQSVGADGAIVLGRWRLTETPNAGSGVFSVVFERRPDGWRIVHDHTSADPL